LYARNLRDVTNVAVFFSIKFVVRFQMMDIKIYKGQSNVAKVDIARWVHLGPTLWGRRGRIGGQQLYTVPLERATAVSYTLSIVTIALSLTIW